MTIMKRTFLAALTSSLMFVFAGCSDESSGGSSSDGDADTDSDDDGDTDADNNATCVDLYSHLSSSCGVDNNTATQTVVACAALTDSMNPDATGALIACIIDEGCEPWENQATTMTAFTGCLASVSATLPLTPEAEEFVAASCAYSEQCNSTIDLDCDAASLTGPAAYLVVFDDETLDAITECLPADPVCNDAEQAEIAACTEKAMPLLELLDQLQP
jgi:hypothetical protein